MKEHSQKENQPQQQQVSADNARSSDGPLAANYTEHQILYLQRTVGNQAVLRLFGMNTAGGTAGSQNSATASAALRQGDSQLVQKKESVEGDSASLDNTADLSTESAAPEDSRQAAKLADEPKKLRVADVRYNAQGEPLDTKLSAAEQKQLGELLAKLQKDDPKFYAEIENEDLLVTVGTLPEGNVGQHHLSIRQQSRAYSKMVWFLFDHSGEDPSQGKPFPPTEAWLKALEEFNSKYPGDDEAKAAERQKMLDDKETRVSAQFSNVIILDLAQIDKQQKLYEKEYEQYKDKSFSSPGANPDIPQSAMGTLRHEAGHLVFNKSFAFDKFGNPLPSKPLPESVKGRVQKGSHTETIKTDISLLSEYAAETLDDPLPDETDEAETFEPFDKEKFKEENDPRFGIGGYHDLDGKEQTPSGFGVRLAENLTLVAAKKTARDLTAAVNVPVFLLTVLKHKEEQRLFNLFMLEGAEKEGVREQFDQLKTVPVLANYKERPIVAY